MTHCSTIIHVYVLLQRGVCARAFAPNTTEQNDECYQNCLSSTICEDMCHATSNLPSVTGESKLVLIKAKRGLILNVWVGCIRSLLQQNLSTVDTIGTQLAVLYREVSLIQSQICTQLYMVGTAERCPLFRKSFIERFHCVILITDVNDDCVAKQFG